MRYNRLNMQRLIVLFSFLIMISCSENSSTDQFNVVEVNGQLAVVGNKIVNKYGDQVALKGVSYGWHNWWPQYFNASSVNTFATNWDCSVLRAAMGVDADDNCYINSPETSEKCVTTVVDAAIIEGVYVIIDWHCHNVRTDEAVAFFDKMSKKYSGKSNVIYEIYNEPTDSQTWPEVKVYAKKVIEAIRNNEKNALILVGSPHWDTDLDLVAADPITGFTNIAYTLHFYAKTHKADVRAKGDIALSKNLALFVSECGAQDYTGAGDLDVASWNEWMIWMKTNSISWCAWCVPSFVKDGVTNSRLWSSDEISDWGTLVEKSIKSN